MPAPRCIAGIAVFALAVACGQPDPAPRAPRNDSAATASAVTALRNAQFSDARRHADAALVGDPRDSRAAAVRAVARYQRAGETLVSELGALIERAEGVDFLDHERGRTAWTTFLGELEAIDRDLATVAADPHFSLEICLACWQYDWNRRDGIDDRDRKMFELEFDGKGGELDAKDPRRRPTFRFDTGDALWARAMIAFQRGGVELVLAYKWSELDKLFRRGGDDGDQAIVIKLIDAGRVQRSRELVLLGLGFADETRKAYLAETDDDREWVPNPRQKSYAMPLEVTDALYETWAGVIGDMHGLLSSRDAIPLRASAELLGGKRLAEELPDAYVDIGRMFREPKDIVIDFRNEKDIEGILRGLVGNGFAQTARATPLVVRLGHMVKELSTGGDTLDRKLRYLIWLN